MTMKKSFVLYYDWEEAFSSLPNEQAGALIKAVFSYEKRGEVPQNDPVIQMAFHFMRPALEENALKYEAQTLANQENGKKGGRPKNPNNPSNPSGYEETKPNPVEAKKAVYVYDSVSVYDSDSVPPEGGEHTRARHFTPPTIDAVAAYVKERGSAVDPQGFIDFYASKGWMIGKTPMKDWKAACRNSERWERWSTPQPKAMGLAYNASSPDGEANQRAREDMERMREFMAHEREKESSV